MAIRSSPSVRLSTISFSVKAVIQLITAVGPITNIPIENTSDIITDTAISMFHTALSPKCFSSHVSNFPFSARASSPSFSSYFSSTSAEYISVLVPCIREFTNTITPLTMGILAHVLFFGFSSVLMCMSPLGSLTATAVFLSPFIIMPSITACPPIFVGFASFTNILLKSICLPSTLFKIDFFDKLYKILIGFCMRHIVYYGLCDLLHSCIG